MSSLFWDSYQFKILGSEDVSEKTKNLVQSILQKLGIQNYHQIHIKQMSSLLATAHGRFNPIATANAIFIDEEYLASLPPNEQRAVIGHEGMHIKNKDCLHILVALCLMDVAAVVSLSCIRKNVENIFAQYSCNASALLAIILGIAAFHRYQEERADKQSAGLLACHEGGISFLQKNLVDPESINQESNSYFQHLKRWLEKKLSLHPLPEERIAYLEHALLRIFDKCKKKEYVCHKL